ncbi:hypothetical protein EGH73_08675 [Epilithonimonas hominis]|uniref:DUF2281 domain-containing protein n=2 Tax=Epilithonimonas hominis TaxID=420404 RepID=A0A3N0X7A1_9FLAO|nr:hypothetical protein EGH73_08675 [Epilithonimonas hominis]
MSKIISLKSYSRIHFNRKNVQQLALKIMNATAIQQLNDKLKSLPDTLVQEVEQFIDYLSFKNSQERGITDIPQWQKDLVLDRVNNPQKPVDAFKMLQELEDDL